MKKIITLALFVAFGLAVMAQSAFTVSPTGYHGTGLAFVGEKMSPNMTYVAGKDNLTSVPGVWNTTNDSLSFLIEIDTALYDDGNGGTVAEPHVMTGSFYDVNANGLAVGCIEDANYRSHAVVFNANTNTYITLYEESGDNSVARAISPSGTTVLGFYFDYTYTTIPCLWTNNGQTRTDLPVATDQQMGFEVSYTAARWMSQDGSVILGYVSDDMGHWIAVYWTLQNGEYVLNPFGATYFQYVGFDDNGQYDMPADGNPYYEFEPTSLSDNGQWISLRVQTPYDMNDWDINPHPNAARFNITTSAIELLPNNDLEGAMLYSIASNGTAVGIYEPSDPTTGMPICHTGVIWMAGANTQVSIDSLYAEDSYITSVYITNLLGINLNGNMVMGNGSDYNGNTTTFIVPIPEHVGINDVVAPQAEPRVKGIFDMMGRKLDKVNGRGIYIIDGKKVYVR